MLSNTHDNNQFEITRSNYEEYLLLYVDNELSQEQRAAVENFLLANTDLQEELDLLTSAKLPLTETEFKPKQQLLAESMKRSSMDEALLFYIDDELKGEEKREVEERLKSSKEFQLQYQSLLKTKLDKATVVPYPNKKELYRHEERKRIPAYWLRIAAAVVLLASIMVFLLTDKPAEQPDVAHVEQSIPVKVSPTNEGQPKDSTQPKEVVIAAAEKVKPAKEATRVSPDDANNWLRQPEKKKQAENEKNEVEIAVAPNKEQIAPAPGVNGADNQTIAVQKNISQAPVTNTNPSTLHSIDATENTEPIHVASVSPDKRSSLKGLLRKATRFIEKTTSISATNENDELLIGAVSIKL